MEIRRALLAGVVGLALVTAGVGCGKVAEKASEKAVEKAIESSSDCKSVDVDGDGGVSAECKDGESFEIDGGGGAKLPGDWPEDLALPDGAKVIFSSTSNGTMSLTAGLDGDLDSTVAAITTQLDDAGYTVEDESSTDAGGFRSASVRATGEAYDATVIVGEVDGGDQGNLTLTYSLTPIA